MHARRLKRSGQRDGRKEDVVGHDWRWRELARRAAVGVAKSGVEEEGVIKAALYCLETVMLAD